MYGEGTGKHLLQNNLSILISYVDKPLADKVDSPLSAIFSKFISPYS